MDAPSHRSGTRILIAASLLSAVLGSIHAFSVFITPLEAMFGASRSAVSLTYSMALVALTTSVLFGPRIYVTCRAATLIALAVALAIAGALIAGLSQDLLGVWLGYSVMFGLANGVGYGFGLQISAQANPGREGLAMGVVTAAYAVGAILAPLIFDRALGLGGFWAAMQALCGALFIAGCVSVWILHRTDARFHSAPLSRGGHRVQTRRVILLWLAYFGAVLAGLMVIGHASGIDLWRRPDAAPWLAPMVIGASNLAGALIAGRLADRLPLGRLLACLALLTCGALLAISLDSGRIGTLASFAAIGFAYGGTISAYPAAIAKWFGMAQGPYVYGRVFTAWGAAGLLGPWLAGALFDAGGGYGLALGCASALGLSSAILITRLGRGSHKDATP